MKKKIQRSLDMILTGLGIATIFTAVLLNSALALKAQLPIVLFGILLMEAGMWGVSRKYFLNKRRYTSLRKEGDNIIALIRELNSSAVALDEGKEDDKRFLTTLERMHNSVNRMTGLASKSSVIARPAPELIS